MIGSIRKSAIAVVAVTTLASCSTRESALPSCEDIERQAAEDGVQFALLSCTNEADERVTQVASPSPVTPQLSDDPTGQ